SARAAQLVWPYGDSAQLLPIVVACDLSLRRVAGILQVVPPGRGSVAVVARSGDVVCVVRDIAQDERHRVSQLDAGAALHFAQLARRLRIRPRARRLDGRAELRAYRRPGGR